MHASPWPSLVTHSPAVRSCFRVTLPETPRWTEPQNRVASDAAGGVGIMRVVVGGAESTHEVPSRWEHGGRGPSARPRHTRPSTVSGRPRPTYLSRYWCTLLSLSRRDFEAQWRPHRAPLAGCSAHLWRQEGSAQRVGAERVAGRRGRTRADASGAHALLACAACCDIVER